MTLEALGFYPELETYQKSNQLEHLTIGRVSAEHKDLYEVKTLSGDYDCELLGNIRFSATDRSDLPAVGDWVAISEYDTGKALIHAIYPRKTLLERAAAGKTGQTQIIATNVDIGFIVQSVNRDFNINRIERYMTLCFNAGIEPVIIISKTDLLSNEETDALKAEIRKRIETIPIIMFSNISKDGLNDIKSLLATGKTFCLLGSSGVGKSTLINSLTGTDTMQTGEISQTTDRGKHVTTSRSLIVLETGGILIDNPGIREVGVAGAESGLTETFSDLASLVEECKFSDCTHTTEKGCAVLKAVDEGVISEADYINFQKMSREIEHFGATVAERRKKDKNFGKMVKQVKKVKKGKHY